MRETEPVKSSCLMDLLVVPAQGGRLDVAGPACSNGVVAWTYPLACLREKSQDVESLHQQACESQRNLACEHLRKRDVLFDGSGTVDQTISIEVCDEEPTIVFSKY